MVRLNLTAELTMNLLFSSLKRLKRMQAIVHPVILMRNGKALKEFVQMLMGTIMMVIT